MDIQWQIKQHLNVNGWNCDAALCIGLIKAAKSLTLWRVWDQSGLCAGQRTFMEKLSVLRSLLNLFSSSSLLLTPLACVLSRIFQSTFAHTRTVGLIPLKLQFMTDGTGHIHSEQSWCRWTVCMCVCICVCVCVCGLVTLLSRLRQLLH